MKKFSKLVAVVLAIAVIICPMMSVVSHATTTGGYKIEAIDANNLKLTINSTDGFIAYHATVGFNSNTAFQSSYNADNYTNGLKVISYTLKTAEANDHNKPAISANASGNSLTVIVMPKDINNLDKCTEIVIGIRVADGTTASLTKIQAADDGADVTADPTLLSFPAAGSDGVIDSTAQDYISSNATTSAHTHAFTQQSTESTYLKTAATCTADATYWYSCATCGLASSTEYFTATGTKIAHTPDNTETTLKQAATCTTNALYYQECSVCHTQLETYWEKPNTALGHNMTFHAATSSTCKVQGNIEYYYCSRCEKFFAEESGATELTEEKTKKALAAHTPRVAVVENNVPATCTTAGSYDSVVYCAVCGDEISRNHVDVQTTEHTPGKPVIENSLASTCTEGGHYDTVVYCTECGAEISRETTNLEPNGHTVVNDAAVAATCTATGLTAGSHCSVCGAVITAQTEVPALGHAYTYHENGNGTHTVGCERCDYSAQETCDTNGTDGVCSKCGYKAATGPVFDASLSAAFTKKVLAISDTFKSETTVLLKNFPANYTFDSFVVTKKILTAPSYTYTSDVAEYVFGTETCTNAKNRAYKITFSNVGLYELGTKLEYKLLVNEGGTLCYYSWEESIVDLAVEYYEGRSTLTPTKAGKDLIADVLKVAETARLYFANVAANAGYTNNSLAEMPVLNSAIDYENYGTKDYGELPDPVSKPTGVTKAVLSLLSSPSFGITMLAPNKADRASWTPESVTVTCSYFSKAENKQITEEMLGTDPDTSKIEVKSTGAVVLTYSGVKLYDADKAVTITATNGTTEYTYTASILSMISPMIDNVGLDGDVYRAIACFNASAHAFWPTY